MDPLPDQGPLSGITGQTPPPPSTDEDGTSESVPETPQEGQAQAETQEDVRTSQEAPPEEASTTKAIEGEEVFFDPTNLDETLMPAYKQMQAAFTKRMQDAAKQRHKIEAYDAFEQNPEQALRSLAQQYGLQVMSPNQAGNQSGQQQSQSGQAWTPEQGDPQNWNDVTGYISRVVTGQVQQMLSPIAGSLQKLNANNIEYQLDQIDPKWRVYEDSMRDNIRAHPTLINDVEKLYRMSVPENVIQQRATQQALQKYSDKAKAAKVGGKSTTSSKGTPPQINNFNDAVEAARQQGRKEGWYK